MEYTFLSPYSCSFVLTFSLNLTLSLVLECPSDRARQTFSQLRHVQGKILFAALSVFFQPCSNCGLTLALRPNPDPSNKLSHRPETLLIPGTNYSSDKSSSKANALLRCRVERKRKPRAAGAGLTALFQSDFWHQPLVYLERHFAVPNSCSFEFISWLWTDCNPWLDLRQGTQAFPPTKQSAWERSSAARSFLWQPLSSSTPAAALGCLCLSAPNTRLSRWPKTT